MEACRHPILLMYSDFRFGFGVADLYRREGLARLDARFLEDLQAAHEGLHLRLLAARAQPETLADKHRSELIIELAPYLEDFLGQLFGIEAEILESQTRHDRLAPLYAVKRKFVQRKALTNVTKEQASAFDGAALGLQLEGFLDEPLTEFAFAAHVARWLENEPAHTGELWVAARYAAWATLSDEGQALHRRGVLFKVPHRLDMAHLVPVETIVRNGVERKVLPDPHRRNREGFTLTDSGMDLVHALDQANYCIKCHNQAKDSCRTGLKEKNGTFKHSVLA